MSFLDDMQGADTRQLLDDTITFLRRFVVFADDHQPIAAALWLLHSHAITAAESTPYLHITSAEKRCGKSRLLELMAALAREAVPAANLSEAAMYRLLGDEATFLIDEIDALFSSNEDRTQGLRGILNAGYRRGMPVWRCVGPQHTPTPFPVFGPKVIAGIDTARLAKTMDTVFDRSITLRLKRRIAAEPVERLLWPKVRADAETLRDRIAEWAAQHVQRLADHEPALPAELDDRAAEGWWALLSIADVAGGDWPQSARKAARELHAAADDEESQGVQLLMDIRTLFGEARAMSTKDLLQALNDLEESPRGAWHEGAGLRARDLARRLRPFGVKPKKVKVGGESVKGYHRDDLEDAWARYIPTPAGEGEPREPREPSASQAESEVPFSDGKRERATQREPETPHSNGEVPQVPQVPHGARGCDEADEDGVPPVDLDALEAHFERQRQGRRLFGGGWAR